MALAGNPLVLTVATPQGEYAIPFQPGRTLREILVAGGFPVRSLCGGHSLCGQCTVRLDANEDIAPTPGELRHLSTEQLRSGLRLACQVIPTRNLRLTLEAPASQDIWRPLREDEYSPVAITQSPCSVEPQFGVAVDIGTTHIRVSLWDIHRRIRIDGRSGLNPQAMYGADVLTRLMEAVSAPAIAQEIGGLVQKAIGQAIAEMTTRASIDRTMVGHVLIVGNTAMLSLLTQKSYELLLQPEYWTTRIDYQPTDVGFLRGTWGIAGSANIWLVPSIGGFIGSDLLAGIIATRLTEQPAGTMLIDFGTNSEIALWDGHSLLVTAAAGGPAFEGSGISCGIPGETGAIFRVKHGEKQLFDLEVLGGGEPKGICGSGLVDAMAQMRIHGQLDEIGRFVGVAGGEIVLHEASAISLHRSDIDAFQRAKAAIGAGVLWLCRQAGIRLTELARVYACGAFGRLLDISNAQTIGLLPPVPIADVELQGNTALAGCETLLLSASAEETVEVLLAVTKVYNMAEEEAYERLFVDNLYLRPIRD